MSPHLAALARDEFTQALRRELRRRSAAFHLGELIEWVEAAWPLIAEDYSVERWADAFLAGLAVA
jgi:hypothetical protein